MNKNKRLMGGSVMPAFMLMASFGCQVQAEMSDAAQGATQSSTEISVLPSPELDTSSCERLSDQVHELKKDFDSKSAVYCYVFTATRGQKILLTTPAAGADPSWQVEYYEDGWKAKNSNAALELPQLQPGDEVFIRVSYKQDKPYQSTKYIVAFGSYPVLKEYSLTAPPVRNRVPVADSGWVVGLQTHGTLTFEARFTDSTGFPLKGASASLPIYLTLNSASPEVTKSAFSDERGIATQTFTLDKCYGGDRAARRNDANRTHYWTSTYNVGRWFIFDGFIGTESEVNESNQMAGFAHICSQTLSRGRI